MAIVYTDDQHYKNIANSIRRKNGSEQTYLPEEMPAAIDDIRTGIDTSDADALDTDIAYGKFAYVQGERLEGKIPEYISGSEYGCEANTTPVYYRRSIILNSAVENDVILRKDSTINITTNAEHFGDARPDEVLIGRFFTSNEGLRIQGTADFTGGGIDTSDANAVESDILYGKIAYANNRKIVGNMRSVNPAKPEITVSSDGLIWAESNQAEGYVTGGIRSTSHQLDTLQAGIEVMPSSDNIVVGDSGLYMLGSITVLGDANLTPGNIKNGVSIFGVQGSLTTEGGGISLPTLTNQGTASDLIYGKQLIDSNGTIVTGTLSNAEEAKFGV